MITLSGLHCIKNAIHPSLLDKSGTDKRKSINFLKQHSPSASISSMFEFAKFETFNRGTKKI
jgi:hypothetical protein